MSTPELFLILSVERTTGGKACVWWRPQAMGYTTSLGEAGRFTREEVARHADPPYHLAIPLSAIEVPASAAKSLARKALNVSRFTVPQGPKEQP